MIRSTITGVLVILVVVVSLMAGDNQIPAKDVQGRLVKKTKRFIINGEDALPHEFPWTVAIAFLLKNKGEGFCSGSLISPRVVLTASHCIKNPFAAEEEYFKALIAGIFPGFHKNPDKAAMLRGWNLVNVAPVFSYKFISPPLPMRLYAYNAYDYGVLILSEPVNSSDTIKFIPVADPTSPQPQTLTCYAAGFGRTGAFNLTILNQMRNQSDLEGFWKYILSKKPDVLQKIGYKIQKTERCYKLYREALMKNPNISLSQINAYMKEQKTANDSFICGLATNASSGVFHGDSGGPLMCRSRSTPWVLYGVNSRGVGGFSRLTLFARVQTISQWLKKIVATYDPEYGSGPSKVPVNRATPSSHQAYHVKAVLRGNAEAKSNYHAQLSMRAKRNPNANM